MRPALILALLFVGVDVAIGFWDLIAVELNRPRETVSFIIRDWAQENLLLVLAIGVILGHLFGPVRQYPVRVDSPPLLVGESLPAGGQQLHVHRLMRYAAYVPLAVFGFLVGWFLLWRYSDGHSYSTPVAGDGSSGSAAGPVSHSENLGP